jgi:GT2 family glycosyltransferase
VSAVDVSVVVASHGRPDRLRILLDSLAAQTLAPERWELVVVHTYPPEVSEAVLDGHELAHAGTLRHRAVSVESARPSIQRNIGWRMAGAPLVAFVDDDCRATPEWLESLVTTAGANPGAIVQGATDPEPLEEHFFERPHFSALRIDPPSREAQTCNILYPRELLERIGGIDERAITGEDIDLSLRAKRLGVAHVGERRALVYHAIVPHSMAEKIRTQLKWQHLAYVVKKNPELREWCTMRVWWKDEHLGAVLALIALAGAGRRRWMLAGVLPYLRIERWRHGPSKRQQLRSMRELPAHFVVELAEVGTFVAGSVRYRTVLL